VETILKILYFWQRLVAQEYKSNVLLLSYATSFNISILLTVTFIDQRYSENALLLSL